MENLNIRNFKLINGDNIIALVNSDNRDNYIVERPVAVYSTMIGGYSFTPWFPFSDNNRVSIDKHNIVGDSGVQNEIKKEYMKFALQRTKFTAPESQEAILQRITDEIANRFEVTEEVTDEDYEPVPTEEIIH